MSVTADEEPDDDLNTMFNRLNHRGGEDRIDTAHVDELVWEVNAARASTPQKKGATRSVDHPSLIQAYDNEWEYWAPIFQKEIDQIERFKSRRQVCFEDIPKGEPIIPFLVDLKRIWLPSGELKKGKCRILVNGVLQDDDGKEHFSPTPSYQMLMLLIAIATLLDLEISGDDVVGAFLMTPLAKPEYGVLPPLFTDQRGNRVYWELLSGFYGRKSASEEFWNFISGILVAAGYKRVASNACAFYKSRDKDFFFSVLYVDNAYSIATDPAMRKEFEDILKGHFEMTHEDDADTILGMSVQHLEDGGRMLTMPKAIDEVLRACFGEEWFKGELTPMSTTFDDAEANRSPRLSPERVSWLRGVLGQLGFIIYSRPCISFAQNKLSTRVNASTEYDEKSVKRVARFLALTQHLGVTFHPLKQTNSRSQALLLRTYADAAYAVHPDGRSHAGLCASLGDNGSGMFFVKSGKIKTVCDSSTGAEIEAQHRMTQWTIWITEFLDLVEIQYRKPVPLEGDNNSAQQVCTEYCGLTKRLRHMLVKINFVMERV